MTQFARFVGIDVAKDRLDVYLHPDGSHACVANTPSGIAQLLADIADDEACAFGCEASGGYETTLLVALSEAGRPVWCLHPSDVRSVARLNGKRAKTDALDAKAIADALTFVTAKRKPLRYGRTQAVIKEMNAARRVILAAINDLKSMLARCTTATTREPLQDTLNAQKAAVKRLDKAIAQAIDSDPQTAQTARRIRSAPGAGPVLTAELIASMPELGNLSSRQAASLVGLAPHPRQSGSTNRNGPCQAGRANLRRVLYMATLSALKARCQPLFPFYQRLRAAGKPFKLAIVAAMRKFIVFLNAMIKHKQTWIPNHQSTVA